MLKRDKQTDITFNGPLRGSQFQEPITLLMEGCLSPVPSGNVKRQTVYLGLKRKSVPTLWNAKRLWKALNKPNGTKKCGKSIKKPCQEPPRATAFWIGPWPQTSNRRDTRNVGKSNFPSQMNNFVQTWILLKWKTYLPSEWHQDIHRCLVPVQKILRQRSNPTVNLYILPDILPPNRNPRSSDRQQRKNHQGSNQIVSDLKSQTVELLFNFQLHVVNTNFFPFVQIYFKKSQTVTKSIIFNHRDHW